MMDKLDWTEAPLKIYDDSSDGKETKRRGLQTAYCYCDSHFGLIAGQG